MSAETTRYPAVDLLTQKAADAQSVADALLDLAKAGRLGDLERDIAAMRRDVGAGAQLVKGPAPAANGLAKSAGVPAASYVASELAWQRGPVAQAMAKAADYERKAYQVSDPQLRNGYLELAAQERQKASAL